TDDVTLRPVPGLNAIKELIANAGKTGLTVESTIEEELGVLPPAVDLAAYRIVQEALTNVVRHAGPVATTVIIRRSTGSVELEVINAPGLAKSKVTGAGVGLVGIRERVALLGGTLQTGGTSDGGYRLRAELPLDGGTR
ncbi:MAG: ATP-binding protein, partial [Lacisediminihabitans sp.]